MWKYQELMLKYVNNISDIANTLEDLVDNDDFCSKLDSILVPLIDSTTYEEIRENINIKLPILKGYTDVEEVQKVKKKLKQKIDNLIEKVEKTEEELIDDYKSTKDYIEIISC